MIFRHKRKLILGFLLVWTAITRFCLCDCVANEQMQEVVQEIVEIRHITDVLKCVKQGDLVIFDLDDTLILNCVWGQWFREKIARLQEKGISKKIATERVIEIIRLFPDYDEAPTETVEPETIDVLKQLYSNNVDMMVLTARSLGELPKGIAEMASVGISFEDCSIFDQEIDFGDLVGLSKGILCAAYKSKGETLGIFLDRINYFPKRIIFVDDKREHVISVCVESKKRGIPRIGFYYRPASICVFDFTKLDAEVCQALRENNCDMSIYDAAT